MEIKRFVVTEKTGAFVAAVYAERFEPYDSWQVSRLPSADAVPGAIVHVNANSFTGAGGGHFYVGDLITASVETARYDVNDSGGRMATPEHGHAV
jgi:hypothetical protein